MNKLFLPFIVFSLFSIVSIYKINAQPVNEMDQSKIDLAKTYMEEGQALYLKGEYNDAAIAFMKAYSVIPLSAFLFNTAVAYEKMKLYKHASEFFNRYLDAEPDCADKEKILERVKDLEEKAKLEGKTPSEKKQEPSPQIVVEEKKCGEEGAPPCPPKIEETSSSSDMKSLLSISTNPQGATISITKFPEIEIQGGTSPLTRTVEEGKYRITVEHPKYKKVDTVIDVGGGRIYVVVVEMSQGEFLGYLTVRTPKPGADVYIDTKEGGSIGKTPLGKPVPAGKHKIWVEMPGFEPASKEVEVQVGEEVKVTVEMNRVSYGILKVKTNLDGSKIILDSREKKFSPLLEKLSPGIHKVEVKSKGMKKIKTTINIEKGMQTTMLVRLNPSPSKTYGWVSLGLTMAFLTAGTILSCYASEIKSDLDHESSLGYLRDDDPRIKKGLWFAIGGDLSFLFGGITAILGIYYFVRDKLPPSEVKIKGPVDIADIEKEKTE